MTVNQNISELIVSRIKRDGPIPHTNHLVKLLPEDHPARVHFGNANNHAHSCGEVRWNGSQFVETHAGGVFRKAKESVVQAIIETRPDVAKKCNML